MNSPNNSLFFYRTNSINWIIQYINKKSVAIVNEDGKDIVSLPDLYKRGEFFAKEVQFLKFFFAFIKRKGYLCGLKEHQKYGNDNRGHKTAGSQSLWL